MKFTMAGTLRGAEYQVSWRDGRLDAPLRVEDALLQLRERGRPLMVTPEGPAYPFDLSAHANAYLALVEVFDDVTEFSGDAPEFDVGAPDENGVD